MANGADVVIVATASGEAQEEALLMAAPQGRVSFFGGLPGTIPVICVRLEPGALPGAHDRGCQRVGTGAQRSGAVALIASGAVPVADLITHRLPLASALTAFDLVDRGEAIKVVLEP